MITIKLPFTDNEIFEKLKERTDYLIKQGIHLDFDPLIIESILILNKIPGITTIFCCSGHPKEGERDGVKGYIMMACNEVGFNNLLELQDKIKIKFKHNVVLELSYNPYAFNEGMGDDNIYYNSQILRMSNTFNIEKGLKIFWKEMEDILTDYLNTK